MLMASASNSNETLTQGIERALAAMHGTSGGEWLDARGFTREGAFAALQMIEAAVGQNFSPARGGRQFAARVEYFRVGFEVGRHFDDAAG